MSANRILPETLDKRVAYFCDAFSLNATILQGVVEAVESEINAGLKAHVSHPEEWREEDCSLMMLDTWVKAIPTGNEKTITYALDLGGTNVRFLRLEAKGNGEVEEKIKIQNIREVDDEKYADGMLDCRISASTFFDYFAQSLQKLMEESGDLKKVESEQNFYNLSFSFSFACNQKSLTNAELLFWTKGFFTGKETNDPVERKDVGMLLKNALKRNSVPLELVALVNDTVGTLISGAYQKAAEYPPCLVGVIIGTGFNICYFEENALEYKYCGKIINMEMGSFNRALPYTISDVEVDWYSQFPGSQKFEKMISGMLLGEIVRRTVITVFKALAPPSVWEEDSLSCQDAFEIAKDTSETLTVTQAVLQRIWKWPNKEDSAAILYVKQLCEAVITRSATLLACALFGIARHLKVLDKGITCGLDGSLIAKQPYYQKKLESALASLAAIYEVPQKIYLVKADDGSGKGAALLGALASYL